MQFRFPKLTPAVRILLIVLASTFVLEVLCTSLLAFPIHHWLALDPSFGLHWAWQFFTHVLIEPIGDGSSVLWTLFHFFFVYLFLAPFEAQWGTKRTVQLFFVATLSAALPAALLGFFFQPQPIMGSSPFFFAGLAAFAMSVRAGQILLFGVMPMKAWHLVLAEIILCALMALIEQNPYFFGTAVGAIAGGALFVYWLTRPKTPPKPRRKNGRKFSGGPQLRVIEGGHDPKPKWLN